MRWGWVAIFLWLPQCVAPSLRAQDDVPIFPLSDIRAGLRGVGRTVFQGDKVEEFQVEILGVLKNAIAPKRDIILARLSGGPLEKTGVIAGMSGSPVYIEGKLVGAVALAFPFSKEPLTGITPIEDMLKVVPQPAAPAGARPASALDFRITRVPTGSAEDARLIPDSDSTLPGLGKLASPGEDSPSLTNLRLPLRMGGFSSEVIQNYTPLFRALGFEPLQGGALSGGESAEAGKTDLVPGSMISLLLVRGDLNLNIDCTVTYRRGNNLYACGHQVLLQGPSQIPFAQSRVLATVPSLLSSFKLDAPGPLMGTIHQDRFNAIYGVVGDKAVLIPLHIQLESSLNIKADYHLEVVQENFLTPLLMNLVIASTLSSTERTIGPATLDIKGQIRLSGAESVDLEDVISSDFNSPFAAGAVVAQPLAFLLGSGFPALRIEGIDLSIVSKNEKKVANLEQVWSTKSEVHPGDHIEVSALLRTPWGETVTEKIPINIPESVNDRTLSVVVGSGASINAMQFRFSPLNTTPRDLHHLVRALNRMRHNNRLYALLMAPERSFILQGDEYPSPPPSLVQTLLADPAASSSLIFIGSSVAGDFETKASPYTIRGQKTLLLKVVSEGP